MATVAINKSKVAHWEEYSTCLEYQKIVSIIFDSLDEPNLEQIISILDNQPKILELVTKISFVECSFGKSSNEKFTKLISPSVKSLAFDRTNFNSEGAVVCAKIQEISSLEEVSFFDVDLRGAIKALCSLLLKESIRINLKLTEASLRQEYCTQLFETMKICPNLKSLELENLDYVQTMIESIATNNSLTKFIIRSNNMYLMKGLNKVNPKTNLVELQLRDFYWLDIKDSTFFKDIKYYHNLTKLVANCTYFDQPASEKFAESLKHLTKLKSLDIANMHASESLMNAIVSNTSITDLTISGEEFQILLTAKCQSVISSVNFDTLSVVYNPHLHIKPVNDSYIQTLLTTRKLKLTQPPYLVMSSFVNGLDSVNCRLTELEIVAETNNQTKDVLFELFSQLEKNTTLRMLSVGFTKITFSTDPIIESICDLLRVNKHIQSLVITKAIPMNLSLLEDILEVLKVNKTLLYLEIPFADRDAAADLIANEFSKSNSTLLYLEPFSEDYRIDMWLHQNRKLRLASGVVLTNIMRSGSILPMEIWLKIFEYLGYHK